MSGEVFVSDEIRGILEKLDPKSIPSVLAIVKKLSSVNFQWKFNSKIRILSNYAIDNIIPLIQLEMYRKGVSCSISVADFNTFEQEFLDQTSVTNTVKHDLLLVSLMIDNLVNVNDDQHYISEKVFSRLKVLFDSYFKKNNTPILFSRFLTPFWSLNPVKFFNNEIEAEVEKLNQLFLEHSLKHKNFFIINLDQLVQKVGVADALDYRFWYQFSSPFKHSLMLEIGSTIARIACKLRIASKKMLVLDCDNTLWGGVIGEDGLEGIKLDPTSYPGSVFYDFQRQVLSLKKQGILLALCSKNNLNDAIQVLEEHPHCLLKKDDFVSLRVNWDDKATNIKSIAEELNLGLDSFVFIDDSSVECEWVKTRLPMVDVLIVPKLLYNYPFLLKQYDGFDRLFLTDEDQRKTQLYLDEKKRSAMENSGKSLEDFLKSLGLKAIINKGLGQDLSRMAQLTQKTNQFNLTTIRYSDSDLQRLAENHDYEFFSMRVIDQFGDYGLTAIVIIKFQEQTAFIESFLMSCRILGKGLESALLAQVLKFCFEIKSVVCVKSTYIPSLKNTQVENFYQKHGFIRIENVQDNEAGRQEYLLMKSDYCLKVPDHITIVEA